MGSVAQLPTAAAAAAAVELLAVTMPRMLRQKRPRLATKCWLPELLPELATSFALERVDSAQLEHCLWCQPLHQSSLQHCHFGFPIRRPSCLLRTARQRWLLLPLHWLIHLNLCPRQPQASLFQTFLLQPMQLVSRHCRHYCPVG